MEDRQKQLNKFVALSHRFEALRVAAKNGINCRIGYEGETWYSVS